MVLLLTVAAGIAGATSEHRSRRSPSRRSRHPSHSKAPSKNRPSGPRLLTAQDGIKLPVTEHRSVHAPHQAD